MAEKKLNAQVETGKTQKTVGIAKPPVKVNAVNNKPQEQRAKPVKQDGSEYTYDELVNICNQLMNANAQMEKQIRSMQVQMQQVNESINFKIVDNMFKIIENEVAFATYGHEDCVKKAVEAVNDFMFQEDDNEQEPTEKPEQ